MLSQYRVLDLTDEKGCLCGKILGDLGADVIKVEKPGGDPARRIGPFYHDVPDSEMSLYWFAFNNNKRSITLDIETATGQELFKRLVESSDFVVESFHPGHMEKLGLSYNQLSKVNPRLVMTSITPYGRTGPYSHYRASDIEIMALGGAMSLAGDPDRAPVRVSFPQSYLWGGLFAASGTLVAHYHRAVTGEGQHVDASAQASVIPLLANAPIMWEMSKQRLKREGYFISGRSVTGAKLRAIYPCKDGYVTFIIYGGPPGIKTNQELTKWLDEKGMATDFFKKMDWSKFNISTVTQEDVNQIEGPAANLFATVTKDEFFKRVLERDMLGYPVNTVEDIMKDPHLMARDFWQTVEHPELDASLSYPGAFAKFSETPIRIRRRAPLIGEHNEEVYLKELGMPKNELLALKEAGIV